MKECPNCKKIYPDDLFFCLDDGLQLTSVRAAVDPSAPTEVAIKIGAAAHTEILPNPVQSDPTQLTPRPEQPPGAQNYSERPLARSSKGPYVIIGILTFICVALAGTMVVIDSDRIFPAANSATSTQNKSTPQTPTLPAPATPSSANTNKSGNPANSLTAAFPSPAGKWKGDWTTLSGTQLDFDLMLEETGSKSIQGNIHWTLRQSARPDKQDKIGHSATEYVRGTFDSATGELSFSGYDKDDPDGVLVMLDVYKLHMTPGGHTLTGRARNGGKWNGNIRLTK
ncbi:MAG: hypothetical protein ACKVQJ_13415 [Pyrinomonadaceae bacterium]